MSATKYRRKEDAVSMAVYLRQISEANTNSAQISKLKRNLVKCINEDVTERQRTVITMYYVDRLNTREIGERLGVNKSTVSRTIKRGENNLKRCLRYGAKSYLLGLED